MFSVNGDIFENPSHVDADLFYTDNKYALSKICGYVCVWPKCTQIINKEGQVEYFMKGLTIKFWRFFKKDYIPFMGHSVKATKLNNLCFHFIFVEASVV